MRIVLPYPPAALWPNKRPHWSAKARATRSYRHWAKLAANGAQPGKVHLVFCPRPLGPKPDLDNCVAAFKAGFDGLADAMGINDRDLRFSFEMGDRCKDGAVIVEITPVDELGANRG